jgi:hypothetical protein
MQVSVLQPVRVQGRLSVRVQELELEQELEQELEMP